MNHILVVDDEAEIRSSLEEILREEGYGVAGASDADEAIVLLRDTPYDVVLLDIWLPGRDGLELLAEIRDLAPEMRPEVVIISGHGTIEAAVKATKLGAYDFLREAALAGAHVDRPQKCSRGPAFAHAERGIQAPVQRRRSPDRRKRPAQGASTADQAHGPHQWSRAHLRRVRHRQGAHRALHPRRKPAPRCRLCRA